jgi:hypothetical protein
VQIGGLLPVVAKDTTDKAEERRQAELQNVLQTVEEYMAEDRADYIYKIIDGEISRSTLHNWRRAKQKVIRGYKADALLRIKERLPKLADLKKFDVYGFALEQIGLDRHSQNDLRSFDGNYSFRHNFHSNVTSNLNYMCIRSRSAPFFASFVFQYKSSNKKERCDGLAIIRDHKLYFLGLAHASMFFGHVKAMLNSQHYPLRGFGLFEDFNDGLMHASNIALVHSAFRPNKVEAEELENYIRRPPFTVNEVTADGTER